MYLADTESPPGVHVVPHDALRNYEAGVAWKGHRIPMQRWPLRTVGYHEGLCTRPVEGRIWRTVEFPEAEARRMLEGSLVRGR